MSGWKRAPSSLVKKATAIGRRVRRRPLRASRRPRARPARRGCRRSGRRCARCRCGEPVITGAASGSRPGARADDVADLVDADRRGRGRASTCTTRSRPSRSSSVSASRLLPRSFDRADLPERRSAHERRARRAQAGRSEAAGVADTAIRDAASRTRRPRPATSPNAATAASNIALPRSEVARRRVTDVAARAEVVRQPSEARPGRRTARTGSPPSSPGTLRVPDAIMSTSSGRRWSIIEVSSMPPWIPIPSSSAGRSGASLVGRHERDGRGTS